MISRLISSALRPSTFKQYQHHVHVCYMFMVYILEEPWSLPLHLDTLAAFYAHLFELGQSHSTIATYNSALGFFHKIRNFPDPTSNFYISKVLQGIKRNTAPVKSLYPLNKTLL